MKAGGPTVLGAGRDDEGVADLDPFGVGRDDDEPRRASTGDESASSCRDRCFWTGNGGKGIFGGGESATGRRWCTCKVVKVVD